jgi:hypothetical protein
MEQPLSLRRPFLSLVALASFSVIGVTTCLAGTALMTWSAPGDDSLTGRAARYDLRYSDRMITPANFSQASAATGLPLPGPPRSVQTAAITGLQNGTIYYFAIKSVDAAGNWSAMSNVVPRVPQEVSGLAELPGLELSPPRPNPARESTRFDLVLPGPMQVRLDVFDIGGRRVRALLDELRGAGSASLTFDLRDDHGSRLAQGVYLVRARLGGTEFMRRVVVTR